MDEVRLLQSVDENSMTLHVLLEAFPAESASGQSMISNEMTLDGKSEHIAQPLSCRED